MDNSFLHSKKLLLVDDEPELLRLVTAILQDEGFVHLFPAASQEEGLLLAQRERPDLAILDVCLPDGDGFSMLRELRAWTDIPVIFLTARDEAADRLAGLGLGADDYIVKPFLPQELLLRVYAVLRRCYKEDAERWTLADSTIDFSRALAEHGVCFESHIYSHGPHGLVTGDQSIEDSAIQRPESYHHWVQDSVNFLRDIFGHFEKGGMSAPRVRAHDTGDDEDYLSAHCTIGKLLSSQEGKSAMEDIMPGLRDGYEGWKRKMNEKYHTNLDIGQPMESYVLSTLWNMLGRDSSMLMELQKRLEKIPNDQSL